jgi:hypothetical protein
MKNQNNKVTAVLFVVALALAPMVQAAPHAEGGPGSVSSRNAPIARSRPASVARPDRTPVNAAANDGAGENSEAASPSLPVITVHATDNVIRGKTGTFVLHMKSTKMLGGTYVFFSLSGTAAQGADYKLVASPVYVSQSGYGTIQIETLPDLRGSSSNQAYSVIVTLNAGAGYAVGKSNSAIMWIKPAAGTVPPNW